jgi:hypothetical protein
MAQVPKLPRRERLRRHKPDTQRVIKPEGRFIPPEPVVNTTDRSPQDVTSINPNAMTPILPEMVYIPPA